jgi:cation transport regulator ChaB
MRPYDTGDQELDERIRALIDDAIRLHEPDQPQHGTDLVYELMVSALKLYRDDADRGDLKLVNSAVKEMRYSFLVFQRFRDIKKVTVFGSARTRPEAPN